MFGAGNQYKGILGITQKMLAKEIYYGPITY